MRFFPEESAELPLKLTRYNVIRKLFSHSFVSELIFIVDDAIRDNTTATYLIKGLDAWNRSSFEVHGEVWSPEAFFAKCADLLPSPDILANNLEENIKKMDAPDQKLWDKLQTVLGKSKAPPVNDLKQWIRVGNGTKGDSSYRPK